MIEVLDLYRHEVSPYRGEDYSTITFHKDGIIGWITLDYNDFYRWLKATDFHYYNKLRWKHFFFDKYTINELFADKKTHDECLSVLNKYLAVCDDYKPIFYPHQKIDLASCSDLVRRFHDKMLHCGESASLYDNSRNPVDYGLSPDDVNFKTPLALRSVLEGLGFTDSNLYHQSYVPFNEMDDGWSVNTSILYSFCDSSRKQELLDAYYKKHPQPEIVYDDKEASNNLSNEKPVNS